MRLWIAFAAATAALAAGLAQGAAPAADPARFKAAVAEAQEALRRADQFEQQARQATDQAARARAESEALAARVQAGEAEITAAETRLAAAAALLQDQRRRLAERQGPLIGLTGALAAMSRRPPALALVQPGSLDDAVRIRSVLAAVLPRIRARTAGLRAEIGRTRGLQAQQEQARRRLLANRQELGRRRTALAEFEERERARSRSLGALALRESDRALALGEEARALEQLVRDEAFQARLRSRLAELPGPVLRPGSQAAPAAAPLFALPVAGRLLTGVGELSDAGVHARGLTLAVEPGAVVRAPAAGRVAFAGPFRSYGAVLILDHGGGWTSVITGLATLSIGARQPVDGGAEIGRAGDDEPRIGIELRHEGRPVPITMLLQA
jgi:murein hydrolase activator